MLSAAYEMAARVATAAAAVAPAGESKVLRSLRARRGLLGRYRAWGDTSRDVTRPLVWMHAPSVGEGLQARPILERLRATHPDIQLTYTFFSPSAHALASRLDVDFRDYLPFDTADAARAALTALRPTALVFSKLDVWPTLTREARARGTRLALVSATLSDESSRRGRLATRLLRPAYASLEAVGAIDVADAERLVTLGVRRRVIEITGDTRYDQVLARARSVDRRSPLLTASASPRVTLVAGSTWPADERVLLAAWLAVRHAVPNARLVIAPHEPTEAHLGPIERWARENDLALSRLAGADAGGAEVLLVDRVGVLGDLYALADVAYVGGGFHAAGLHSVIEPAAFGAPVLFGPRWQMSRDARILLEARGAMSVSDVPALERALREWFTNRDARSAAGHRGRTVVESGIGAADRTLELVMRLLA
jgi:3-deoxy-D-manno-octulosonic-acid transferase